MHRVTTLEQLLKQIEGVADRLDDASQCTALRLTQAQRAECLEMSELLFECVGELRRDAGIRGIGSPLEYLQETAGHV